MYQILPLFFIEMPGYDDIHSHRGVDIMVTTHNLGYPRIGAKRTLKFALED
ncbi:MAG: hypothetical protein ACI83P_001786, partial [Janthinobacterium sp.]